jgi:hypothetical protein
VLEGAADSLGCREDLGRWIGQEREQPLRS